MLIALGALVIVALASVAVLGILAARENVRQLEASIDSREWGASAEKLTSPDLHPSEKKHIDALETARFTSSLLSLSKVQTQVTHDFPAPVLDEASSLVSVRQLQSKSPDLRF